MQFLTMAILWLSALAQSQSVLPSTSIHEQVLKTYSFEPHLLSHDQQAAKSADLDRFWSEARAHGVEYVPSLRVELADLHNPPFFLYDGSMLLESLSDTHEDRQIELAAMAHCDLRDLQPSEYFLQVHHMAAIGEDTTVAAFHILDDPKFQVFIPQHVLTLGQDYSLVYLLVPTDQHFWEKAAIGRLAIEQDPQAQTSLLTLLWYAQTTTADKAITSFSNDPTKPEANRKVAHEMEGRPDIGSRLAAGLTASTESDLRKMRQDRMKAVSDEALSDLDRYTIAIRSKRE